MVSLCGSADVNIEDIRHQIVETFEQEQATHALERLIHGALSRTGAGDIEDKAERTLSFIMQYIEATPFILEATLAAADHAGMRAEFEPVLDAAQRYFHESVDLIPDHLGLVGLIDDSYLTQSLVQRISQGHQERTGLPLVTFDLENANMLIRAMIGEPLATHLDRAVHGAIAMQVMQETIQRLSQVLGDLPLAIGDPYTVKFQLDDCVDIQLGQFGSL